MSVIFVTGVNPGSAPVEVRERLAMSSEDVVAALAEIGETDGLAETMVVSTCNRVEVWGVAETERGATAALEVLCRRRGVDPQALAGFVRTKTATEAIRHCFRVAASLDSVVVGEPQILGQVKDAFAVARRCGTVGPLLDRVVSRAFSVAKRVRTETGLGQHAVSVSFVAVELARKIFGELRTRSALLIGAGEMGELSARHLVSQGLARLYVANRTWSKAAALAEALAATPIPFERRAEALAMADIVITSTGAPDPIVTRDVVHAAMTARGHRPLFVIDIAVPRDVEPGVGELPNVFCYDVDDLRHVAEANRKEREREALKAEGLVEREVAKWAAGLQALDVVPTIVSLRRRLDAMREAEMTKALARIPDASPATREALEALSTALLNKILHPPTSKLRDSAQTGSGDRWVTAVKELFDLDDTRGADRRGGPVAAAVADQSHSEAPRAGGLRPPGFIPAPVR
jgi:glutamyl-tRNA reductase